MKALQLYELFEREPGWRFTSRRQFIPSAYLQTNQFENLKDTGAMGAASFLETLERLLDSKRYWCSGK